ncbi:unnamed protein product [Spirodela intermedia]|uniref:non-specific serine/threonine protein kinase n=1 Tax=Spirodela intermedia TaxID=51605 RepID=A0A7I8IDA1_SPIIN|nr:unnamed protein product [Spirodela intermedia]CAA6655022.1 unnamed protein product [Spirodela intermedia]
MRSNASATAAYYDKDGKQDLNLKGGHAVQAWIDYDGVAKLLNVTVSPFSWKPTTPIISFPVDLSSVLLEEMFVGISSSTGLLSSSHYLFGWSFSMNGLAPSLDLSTLPSLPKPKKKTHSLAISTSVAAFVLLVVAVIGGAYLFYRIKNADVIEPWELQYGPHRFCYEELKRATKGFRDKELLGCPPSTKAEVAVKRVSHESKQGIREFVAEIASIGRLRHRNLVQLQGWCRRRGDLLLVYDYMPNGSLDKYLFDNPPKVVLSWNQRLRIIRGVAAALVYLHEEWESVVIHRDVKASNVLLDADMNGRLGTSAWQSSTSTGATPLTRTGKATTSADVFAFGAMMLEVVCGRRPIEPKALPEELILVDWVWELWLAGRVSEAVDHRFCGDYAEEEVNTVVRVALMCSHPTASERPTMRDVVRYLDGDADMPELRSPLPNEDRLSPVAFDDFVHSYPSSSFEKVSS